MGGNVVVDWLVGAFVGKAVGVGDHNLVDWMFTEAVDGVLGRSSLE